MLGDDDDDDDTAAAVLLLVGEFLTVMRKGKERQGKRGKGSEANREREGGRLETFISEEHSRKNILMDLKGEEWGD